jgi:hypothetical protein
MKNLSITSVDLLIAETVIRLQGELPFVYEDKQWRTIPTIGDLAHFFYRGRRQPDVIITVSVVERLPLLKQPHLRFVTDHPDDGSENWRMVESQGKYFYLCPIPGKKQVISLNNRFDRAKAYVNRYKGRSAWNLADLVYDFLQVLMIHYFSVRKHAVLLHAAGLQDRGGNAYVFTGKSQNGKSTMCRLWHRWAKAEILNDDRLIIINKNSRWQAFGCPWHGDFNRYSPRFRQGVWVKKIFFISHSRKNNSLELSPAEALTRLIPVSLPVFWNKKLLISCLEIYEELAWGVPSFDLGFAKDKRVIDFVRGLPK